MGRGHNRRIANNWQAVRWGAAGLAALACDEPGANAFAEEYLTKIVKHFEANLGGGAWNPEGLGYLHYPLMFSGPFGMAAERAGLGDLRELVPNLGASTWIALHSAAPIPTRDDKAGIGLDFSDDNAGTSHEGLGGIAFWLHANDQEQLAALRYAVDRQAGDQGPATWDYHRGGTLYHLLHYPHHIEALPAAQIRPLAQHDPVHGIIVSRNSWNGANDIIVGLNAPHRRPRGGHSGPDTNGLRMLGLGGRFIAGGGRTGRTAGTTGLFGETIPERHDGSQLGELSVIATGGDGSYVAQVVGNSFGLPDHRRLAAIDMSGQAGAPLVIISDETATGARRWRLATPELNSVTTDSTGATITAPSGATLRITVIAPSATLITTEQIRRGLFQDKPAGWYYNQTYYDNTVVEVACYDSVRIVMTLQNGTPPTVEHQGDHITVGSTTYHVGEETISGGGLPSPQAAP